MLNDEKPKPRVVCVFYSQHEHDEVLGESLNHALDWPEMGDQPFALVGPSRDNYWTRVWYDPQRDKIRVVGGCWGGNLEDVDTYGLADDPDDDDDGTRQPDIIALIQGRGGVGPEDAHDRDDACALL